MPQLDSHEIKELTNLFPGFYHGKVSDNKDPRNLGRLKISCPVAYGDNVPDYWAFPRGSMGGMKAGIYWLPSIGDPVYVSFLNGDPRHPHWEYGWWLADQVPEGAAPGVYILCTPSGHRIELNEDGKTITIKTAGDQIIKMDDTGIFLGNSDQDLFKFLDSLFQLFAETTVATPAGPAFFNNVTAYNELRDKIQEFLKTE